MSAEYVSKSGRRSKRPGCEDSKRIGHHDLQTQREKEEGFLMSLMEKVIKSYNFGWTDRCSGLVGWMYVYPKDVDDGTQLQFDTARDAFIFALHNVFTIEEAALELQLLEKAMTKERSSAFYYSPQELGVWDLDELLADIPDDRKASILAEMQRLRELSNQDNMRNKWSASVRPAASTSTSPDSEGERAGESEGADDVLAHPRYHENSSSAESWTSSVPAIHAHKQIQIDTSFVGRSHQKRSPDSVALLQTIVKPSEKKVRTSSFSNTSTGTSTGDIGRGSSSRDNSDYSPIARLTADHSVTGGRSPYTNAEADTTSTSAATAADVTTHIVAFAAATTASTCTAAMAGNVSHDEGEGKAVKRPLQPQNTTVNQSSTSSSRPNGAVSIGSTRSENKENVAPLALSCFLSTSTSSRHVDVIVKKIEDVNKMLRRADVSKDKYKRSVVKKLKEQYEEQLREMIFW